MLAFTDDRVRPQVVEAAASELRPYLAFDLSPMSQLEFERARKEVFAAVAATRVQGLITVSPYPPEIRIGVRTQADADLVRSVIPVRYRAITHVVAGSYVEPIPE
ncbi:MAG TPA: hypothetical protein VFP53_09045 [Sphingomicrobium sp.]|nr:hypothetical protein [Sphingomicrobium sp.]